MTRKARPDLVPEIMLDDDPNLKDLNDTLASRGHKRRARKIYYETPWDDFEPAMYIAQRRWSLINNRRQQEADMKELGREYVRLDAELLSFLMDRCVRADCREKLSLRGDGVARVDGKIIYNLFKVGCRVEMTAIQIAAEFPGKISREHVARQLKLLFDLGIIVNKGKGWYEFDVDLCWHGRMDVWKAYKRVQVSQFDSIFVMPDGREVRYRNFMRPIDVYNEINLWKDTIEIDGYDGLLLRFRREKMLEFNRSPLD